jgi:hypothetical protein
VVDSRKLSQNIETDSFDRALFEELVATSEELKNLIESGSHLLPNFRSKVVPLLTAAGIALIANFKFLSYNDYIIFMSKVST